MVEPVPKSGTLRADERVRLLDATRIFSSLDRPVLEAVAGQMGEAFCNAGQVVVAEEEEGDRLFVIIRGRAEVSQRAGRNQVPLACLEQGEVFGEIGLLASDRKRQATVTAITDLHLLVLDGTRFNELAGAYTCLSESLQEIAEIRLKINFLKRSSPFRSLAPERMQKLVVTLETVWCEPGTTVIQQGERGQTCYLLRSGRMEVFIREGEHSERKVATLRPGCILGEAALLTEEPRNATVRAVDRCQLLALKRDDLLEVLREDGQVRMQLLSLLHQRDRPRRVEGIAVHEQTGVDGETIRVFKHPELGTYVRVSPEAWFIWQRLDGRHTLKDLTLDFMAEWKCLAPSKIAAIVAEFARGGFIRSRALRSDIPSAASDFSWQSKLLRVARHVMEWRVLWRGADGLFSVLYRLGGFLFFTKAMQVLLMGLCLAGLVTFFLLSDRLTPILHDPEKSRLLLLFIIPASLAALFLHEVGHGLTTKHYGREVRGAGVGWYWFGPVAFVDTSDMWSAGRWPRIAVSLAGPYANVVLASAASLAAWLSPSLFTAAALWYFAMMSYLTALMNLNPLLEYDGYYLLSDFLGQPNLRGRCLQWLGQHFLGALRRPHELLRHWFDVVYGLSSVAYVAFMAWCVVMVYRFTLEAPLRLLLPESLATGLPWAAALVVVVSALFLIMGELHIVSPSKSDTRAPRE